MWTLGLKGSNVTLVLKTHLDRICSVFLGQLQFILSPATRKRWRKLQEILWGINIQVNYYLK